MHTSARLLLVLCLVRTAAEGSGSDGCHGPSWCKDKCRKLPFNEPHASVTPSLFSHADQYRIELDDDIIQAESAFFQLFFSVRGSETSCALHVGLIPPPAGQKVTGGVGTVLYLGGSNTSSASISNIFPPSKEFIGAGNWTLLVSTIPKNPCPYQVQAKHLAKPIKEFPADVNFDSTKGDWILSEASAELAAPIQFKVSPGNCNFSNIKYSLAGFTGGQTVHGTVAPGILATTLGAPQATYLLGFHYTGNHTKTASFREPCSFKLTIEKTPVISLEANEELVKFTLSESSGKSGLNFRIPFSPKSPFIKATVVGEDKGGAVVYSFFGDSFFAKSQQPVMLSAESPGMFFPQGSPSLFVPDDKKDAQREDYLLQIGLSGASEEVTLGITLYPSLPQTISFGKSASGHLRAGPKMDERTGLSLPPRSMSAWFVGRMYVPSTNASGPIIKITTLPPENDLGCSEVYIGIRNAAIPNGPFGSNPWDLTNTTLTENIVVSIDLRKNFFPPPFPFVGPIYMFVGDGYGNCRFKVSYYFENV